MTADEIRNDLGNWMLGKPLDQCQLLILMEIAAQLAEANALARFELGLEEDVKP